VDHWAFGPHHLWTYPDTGILYFIGGWVDIGIGTKGKWISVVSLANDRKVKVSDINQHL
jgi:hypothetical protein